MHNPGWRTNAGGVDDAPRGMTPHLLKLQAVRQAENSMGWPTSDCEVHPDQDTPRMIDETLRRASENLRAELRRADFG